MEFSAKKSHENLRIEMISEPKKAEKFANVSLIEAISNELPRLNKTQTKVAQAILADPKSATESSIASLAKRSSVSEPSVNRFCKRFDAKGFPDLKLRIARSLASGICYTNPKVSPSDNVASFTPKIFDSAIKNLALVRESICHQQINQAIEILVQAKRIYFFALGASAIVARDAANQLHGLNLPVSSHDDILIQQMLASSGNQKDVFFIVSDTDTNQEIIDVAQTAKNNGSIIISLTAAKSHLGDISALNLYVDRDGASKKPMPISSRVVFLVILDVLTTGVALNKGVNF